MLRHHQELFENVRIRPGMYVNPATYEVVAAFVQGYDFAYEGGLLKGFREWLVLRLNDYDNLVWSALVLNVAFPDAKSPEGAVRASEETERHAINTLFGLIGEFDEIRQQRDGLKDIFVAYDQWVKDRNERQDRRYGRGPTSPRASGTARRRGN